ncbi:MAG: DUF6483 family protein [Clostridium sp.]|nr:DUF6483 family protein [Clostridium sp.]
MFEQDYIMRLIKEMVRTILKLIFHIDTDNPGIELLNDKEAQDILNRLTDMVDAGNINEAENHIFEITADNDMKHLEMAVLFYSYLNDKDDEFLQAHNFSRDEIQLGLKDLLARYGMENMSNIFLM